ncbi:hypothetical protein [Taibaiella koreensis]|uniref:hypothetical protein n=1 Tax=Taibaiella koreensis TaxID=1268548 RepID=UPI000E59EFCA|nr:hypothetical protein [Taibaiella koreensis]
MKSLEQIKQEYALSKRFKSWENFCSVANDNMFVRAIDEIATLYAEYRTRFILSTRSFTAALQPAGVALQEHFG